MMISLLSFCTLIKLKNKKGFKIIHSGVNYKVTLKLCKNYLPVEVFDQGFHLQNSDLLIPIEVKNSKKIGHDLFWVSASEHLEDVHELHKVDVLVAISVVKPEEVTL